MLKIPEMFGWLGRDSLPLTVGGKMCTPLTPSLFTSRTGFTVVTAPPTTVGRRVGRVRDSGCETGVPGCGSGTPVSRLGREKEKGLGPEVCRPETRNGPDLRSTSRRADEPVMLTTTQLLQSRYLFEVGTGPRLPVNSHH